MNHNQKSLVKDDETAGYKLEAQVQKKRPCMEVKRHRMNTETMGWR